MAANTYLAIGTTPQDFQEVSATQTSAGIGNANQIIALDATGFISSTMLPDTGVITMTASESISAGAFINIWSSTGVKVRNADSSTPTKAHGFVNAAISNAGTGAVILQPAINTGVTSLTIGTAYFLSTTGSVTATKPTSSGNIIQAVGVANATTSIVAAIGPTIVRA